MALQQNSAVISITADETLDLRSRILRPGQSLETVQYAEDFFTSTIHLGIKENGKIICNGTFMVNACSYFPKEPRAYRLRGMAVETEFQGRGLGTLILKKAEDIIREKKYPLLWFNARTSAQNFYEKNGYRSVGDVFDIPGGGPHIVMYKFL